MSGQGLRIINGKVHDAQGRLLWIAGQDGPGRPMTFHDLLLADFAELPTIVDEDGHRTATQVAARNLGMDLWDSDLRARLTARQATTAYLPDEAPCRWIAQHLTELLDGPLLLDGAFVPGRRLWPGEVERIRDRVEGRMDLLYDIVEFLLDRSEPAESRTTISARTAEA